MDRTQRKSFPKQVSGTSRATTSPHGTSVCSSVAEYSSMRTYSHITSYTGTRKPQKKQLRMRTHRPTKKHPGKRQTYTYHMPACMCSVPKKGHSLAATGLHGTRPNTCFYGHPKCSPTLPAIKIEMSRITDGDGDAPRNELGDCRQRREPGLSLTTLIIKP